MGESKSKTYTITDIAKASDVTVASVSKYVKREKLKPVKTGQNNAKFFSHKDFEDIVAYYKSKRQDGKANHVQTTKDDVIAKQSETIELLKQQLAEKDKQIERQNTQIDHLTTAVGNIGDLTKQVAKLTENAQQLQLAEKVNVNESELVKPVNDEKNDDEKQEHGAIWRWLHGKD
ncbi:hypothetical protein [Limosilactobacillus reuteri]|uniref:hypothetical protein n=1 Tax=Limosilactobacillus reuteri TaxID=1598 RepID=UPI00195E9654|nr:hypothetical protein [Limosilactobacillus reuteri]MBM6813047.1 hypothetical protein [Limosilactobacillus reuteri]